MTLFVLPASRLDTPVARLRVVAFVEGWSYLVLLAVAMPLKYLGGYPLAVRVAGSIHGALFVLFCVALAHAMIDRRWSLARAALFLLSSLVPFGTFAADGTLRREQERC
ncbi:MAG TPA: DUF3817 domain-containing protein [Candidatus Limnocylindrales bacterium]|nr:DUF3817 domain-containing protein [Candidatus Limnocylindrales bacterium]